MSPKDRRKVVIIGIDGLSRTILEGFKGHIPNIQKIIKKGFVTYPVSHLPITPAAWTTIATGLDATHHGIVDFIYRKERSYDLGIVNSKLRKSKALWHHLSNSGLNSVVINYPITYPPEKINGVMVSGMLTPSVNSEFVYPSEEKQRIIDWVDKEYRIFINKRFEGKGTEFLRDIISVDECKGKIAIQAIEYYDWDLFIIVFMGLDHACHMFWHYIDKTNPRYNDRRLLWHPIKYVLKNIDKYVGKIINYCGEWANVFIVSDHGFGSLHKYIDLNKYLMKKGFLKVLDPNQGLNWDNIDWDKTIAYSMGYLSPIYLNIEGREPCGIVPPERYNSQRKEVFKAIRDLERIEGVKITDVVYAENIGNGPYKTKIPDMMIIFNSMAVVGKGYSHEDLLGKTQNNIDIIYKPRETGTHRPEAVLISNMNISNIKSLCDVGRAISRTFSIEIQ